MVRLKSDVNINEILHQMHQVHHRLPPGFCLIEAPGRQQTDNSLWYLSKPSDISCLEADFASQFLMKLLFCEVASISEFPLYAPFITGQFNKDRTTVDIIRKKEKKKEKGDM